MHLETSSHPPLYKYDSPDALFLYEWRGGGEEKDKTPRTHRAARGPVYDRSILELMDGRIAPISGIGLELLSCVNIPTPHVTTHTIRLSVENCGDEIGGRRGSGGMQTWLQFVALCIGLVECQQWADMSSIEATVSLSSKDKAMTGVIHWYLQRHL